MSNANDHPDSKKSNAEVILPGGLPALKPPPVYKPPVRQPQLSNADDIAAIHNNRMRNRNIESVCEDLEGILFANPEYLEVVSEFLERLEAEIENPTDPDSAA